MRLQLLLTAGLVLFLGKFASPNECARNTGNGKCGTNPKQPARLAQPLPPAPSFQPAKSTVSPKAVTVDTESSTLVINKLLYI
jgi:hypothetical protein